MASPSSPDGEALRELLTAQVSRWRRANPDVEHLTAAELQRLLQGASPPALVDVRSNSEYAVSTLPGAIRPAQVAAEAARGRPLVAFCTVGMRSSLEARVLKHTPHLNYTCHLVC